ncbi:MAG: hypothetical protein BWX80_00366 [Candidatus Hydrogenedentes bacterium ADurb.Bin101]|nr:MAG: hypothetical protein BWX80_00366 [Candidatus Hydrogenedentes bacterium ADurb.Bin101]
MGNAVDLSHAGLGTDHRQVLRRSSFLPGYPRCHLHGPNDAVFPRESRYGCGFQRLSWNAANGLLFPGTRHFVQRFFQGPDCGFCCHTANMLPLLPTRHGLHRFLYRWACCRNGLTAFRYLRRIYPLPALNPWYYRCGRRSVFRGLGRPLPDAQCYLY